MVCTSVTIGTGTPPPPGGDKYYDCVSGKCAEKVGGKYLNDPLCASVCKPAADNTGTLILLGVAALAAMYLFAGKR